jgi:hypothetical protein
MAAVAIPSSTGGAFLIDILSDFRVHHRDALKSGAPATAQFNVGLHIVGG